jgi:mannose-6-phosphate isomerase
MNGITKIKFIESPYFTVEKYELSGQINLENNKAFMLMSVIEGEGILKVEEEKYPITKGENFMLSSEATRFNLDGALSIIVSYVCMNE